MEHAVLEMWPVGSFSLEVSTSVTHFVAISSTINEFGRAKQFFPPKCYRFERSRLPGVIRFTSKSCTLLRRFAGTAGWKRSFDWLADRIKHSQESAKSMMQESLDPTGVGPLSVFSLIFVCGQKSTDVQAAVSDSEPEVSMLSSSLF